MSATGMSSRYSVARLEGVEDALDGVACSRRRPPAATNASASPTSCGKSSRVADRVRVDDRRPRSSTEDEQRERGRVAPDRRFRPRRRRARAPSARPLRPRGQSFGENERLHRADRPAPAPGRCVRRCSRGSARPRGGASRRLVAPPDHQQCQPRAAAPRCPSASAVAAARRDRSGSRASPSS